MSQDRKDARLMLEKNRIDALSCLTPQYRAEMGQFFTPLDIAKFMSSLFEPRRQTVRILDAGAGIGNLFTACIEELCPRHDFPKKIEVVAYEAEPAFLKYLNSSLIFCKDKCNEKGIDFSGTIRSCDFIAETVRKIKGDLFEQNQDLFTLAILNPPYKKLPSSSESRLLLDSVQLGTSNLYSAFVWLAVRVLEDEGELVAITPRSFCNGPYFKNFRKSFLGLMKLKRIHIFKARDHAFQVDDVLQENVIFHAKKNNKPQTEVLISCSDDPGDGTPAQRIAYDRIVQPGDKDFFIHIPTEEISSTTSKQMAYLPATIKDLGLTVSTGRVVDFRARNFIRALPGRNTSPLIYPTHFGKGFVEWPLPAGRKPNAIDTVSETETLLVPSGYYVLAKRFSAKEESRRIVAALHDPNRVPSDKIGFENHLNYFHAKGFGLDPDLAKGLTLYLNSSLVDRYFRHFNGHTQVNATDLRKIRYPAMLDLIRLGSYVNGAFPEQREIDQILEREIFNNAQEKAVGKAD